MYRLTSPYHLRALFAAAAAAATYSPRRCVADPPPPPLTENFVNIGEKVKIRRDGGAISERKVLLSKLLSENVAMLSCESSADGGICHVYLIGTCHDSPVVFLELCPSRLIFTHVVDGRTTVLPASTLHEKPNFDGTIRDGNGVLIGEESEFTYNRQAVKYGAKLQPNIDGQGPESEFMEAYKLAMQYGAKVILGDRPIEITMQRISANISRWDSYKSLYYTMFHKDVFRDKLGPFMFPSIVEPLVHERDQYMSAKLLEVAWEHNLVVAVVGKSHLAGIQKNWKQPVELERLLSLPAEKNQFTAPLIIVAVAGAVKNLSYTPRNRTAS